MSHSKQPSTNPASTEPGQLAESPWNPALQAQLIWESEPDDVETMGTEWGTTTGRRVAALIVMEADAYMRGDTERLDFVKERFSRIVAALDDTAPEGLETILAGIRAQFVALSDPSARQARYLYC